MFNCRNLSDPELTRRLKKLVIVERGSGAAIIAHLKEFEERKLHEDAGHTNLFTYCTGVLRLSEAAAYKKIRAVEAARRHPDVITMLHEGRLHLEALAVLSPHLNEPDYRSLLEEACGKTKREVEALSARAHGRLEKADCVRHVGHAASLVNKPPESPGLFEAAPSAPPPRPAILPAPAPPPQPRVRFAFTGSDALLLKLEKAKALLRHKHPEGRLEDVIEEVLEVFLERRDPDRKLRRRTTLKRPPRGAGAGRYIAQEVKDAVWERDGGRCAFVRPDGSRCEETAALEFDHVVPFALGGAASVENLRLLCAGHNRLRAWRAFGGPKLPSRP